MPHGLPNNTSGTARLLLGAPSYVVGWQEVLYISQPAAGAQWAHKADGRFKTRLITARFTFTADAVVANRNPRLELSDHNGVPVMAVPAGQGIAAGSFETVSLAVGAPQTDIGGAGFTYGNLPDLMIPGDWTWGTQTPGMDAGDQYSGIVLVVQRYPNDAAAVEVGQ